jgi:sirohydrochlorin ferrochelatase
MPSAQPRTAVLLIAHGSRHASANDDLRALVDRIAGEGGYAIVEPSFLELAEPTIAEAAERCVAQKAQRVLMIPYFLSAGVHLKRDLAAARAELAKQYPKVEFRLGAPLGPHPLLEALVLERIRQLESKS